MRRWHNDILLVQLLRRCGADLMLTMDGKTLPQIAQECGNEPLAQVLSKKIKIQQGLLPQDEYSDEQLYNLGQAYTRTKNISRVCVLL